jgi:hypothetical protein
MIYDIMMINVIVENKNEHEIKRNLFIILNVFNYSLDYFLDDVLNIAFCFRIITITPKVDSLYIF